MSEKRVARITGLNNYLVIFGHRDGVNFYESVAKKPTWYKTMKGAEKAKKDWEEGNF